MPNVAPTDIRELFDAMSGSPPHSSLEDFIQRFDWSATLIQNVYYTFLNRLPESESVIRTHAERTRAELALDALASAEFQTRIIELLLRAYPEKQRLIHIHVPKTAGVDLSEKFTSDLPYVHFNHSRPEMTSSRELLAHLAETSRRVQSESRILVTGHIPLAFYVDSGLCRFGDRIFAVFREPRESLLSLVNYLLRRIQEDPDCLSPDMKSYANVLGVDRFKKNMDIEARRKLGRALLMNDLLMYPNLPKQLLGRGDYDLAIDLIVCTNIELIPIEAYNLWLREEWGIDSTTRTNASPRVLRSDDLDRAHLQRMNALCKEDSRLHRRLMRAWRRKGGTRIFGDDLLRM